MKLVSQQRGFLELLFVCRECFVPNPELTPGEQGEQTIPALKSLLKSTAGLLCAPSRWFLIFLNFSVSRIPTSSPLLFPGCHSPSSSSPELWLCLCSLGTGNTNTRDQHLPCPARGLQGKAEPVTAPVLRTTLFNLFTGVKAKFPKLGMQQLCLPPPQLQQNLSEERVLGIWNLQAIPTAEPMHPFLLFCECGGGLGFVFCGFFFPPETI